MDGDGLLSRLRTLAPELVALGVCDAAGFDDVRADLERRLRDGSAGKLGFTYRDPARATDVGLSFPWAARLVVGAVSYLPAAGTPGPAAPGAARVARFATDDHYRPLRAALGRVAEALRGAGHEAVVLVDDAGLVDRAPAVRAGVGWWGKNAMVLAPGHGPWMLIGSVVTDAHLPITGPMERDCGTCAACLPACPTGALVAPGVLDARLCIAHWTQVGGVIPKSIRPAMGDRLYGCDDCLEACPPGRRLMEESAGRRGRHDVVALLGAADRTLLDRFAHFYVPGRRARYLRRNALIVLGNTGGPAAVPVAAGYLGHPDWLLRAHAAWALGRLGGPQARAGLAAAAKTERHPQVVEELASATMAAAAAAVSAGPVR